MYKNFDEDEIEIWEEDTNTLERFSYSKNIRASQI